MTTQETKGNDWKLDDGRIITLVTIKQFKQLPEGIMLTSINGEEVKKGTDYIHEDTRFGYMAFGLPKVIVINDHPLISQLNKGSEDGK